MLLLFCRSPTPGGLPTSSAFKAGSQGTVSQVKLSFGPRLRRALCAACSTARRGSSRFGPAGEGPPPAASREGKKHPTYPKTTIQDQPEAADLLQQLLPASGADGPPRQRASPPQKGHTQPFYCTELQNYEGSQCQRGGSAPSRPLPIAQQPLPPGFFKAGVYKYRKYFNKC